MNSFLGVLTLTALVPDRPIQERQVLRCVSAVMSSTCTGSTKRQPFAHITRNLKAPTYPRGRLSPPPPSVYATNSFGLVVHSARHGLINIQCTGVHDCFCTPTLTKVCVNSCFSYARNVSSDEKCAHFVFIRDCRIIHSGDLST